jgi:hypothetical protein
MYSDGEREEEDWKSPKFRVVVASFPERSHLFPETALVGGHLVLWEMFRSYARELGQLDLLAGYSMGEKVAWLELGQLLVEDVRVDPLAGDLEYSQGTRQGDQWRCARV